MNYVLIFHKLCRNSCRIVVECPIFKYFPYHYPSYEPISRFRCNQYYKKNIFRGPLVVFYLLAVILFVVIAFRAIYSEYKFSARHYVISHYFLRPSIY